jgi:hypothetical protein
MKHTRMEDDERKLWKNNRLFSVIPSNLLLLTKP